MRKLILKMSVSVDGFVGTSSGNLDWIFPSLSEDAVTWTLDTLRQAGIHIMGHATYLDMAVHWPSSTEVFAAPMNQTPKGVFSKTLKSADWPETRIMRG